MKLYVSGEDDLAAIPVFHKKMGAARSFDDAGHMEVSNHREPLLNAGRQPESGQTYSINTSIYKSLT